MSSVKLKMKVVYISGDERRRDEKAECAGRGPAVAPAKVLAGDDEADRDAHNCRVVKLCFSS